MTHVKNIKAINKNEIARITGFSPSYVYRLLVGERKNQRALKKVLLAIKQNAGISNLQIKNSDITQQNQYDE